MLLPNFERTPDDAFLRKIDASGKKWVIVTDPAGEPVFVLDSHQFLRDALFDELEANPNNYLHRPTVVRDMKTKLGDVIGRMKVVPEHADDDVIDNDLILVWGDPEADHHRHRSARPAVARYRSGGWRRCFSAARGSRRSVRRHRDRSHGAINVVVELERPPACSREGGDPVSSSRPDGLAGYALSRE